MKRKINIKHYNLPRLGETIPPPIIVTGMHNSGTSILTKIIHKSGAFMDNSMDHFESRFFSRFINDKIIMGGGEEWASLPIMKEEEVMSYKNTAGNFLKENWVVEYIQNGYDGESKWGFKDPRVCVLMSLYYDLFPNAKLVYVERKTKDIAASLCKKGKKGVGVLDDFEHWRRLSKQYKNRAEKHKDNFDCFTVKYENMCDNTEEVVEDLTSFLGTEITKEVRRVVDEVHSRRINSYENEYISRGWGVKEITRRIKELIKG